MFIKAYCCCKMDTSLLHAGAPTVSKEDRDRFLKSPDLKHLRSYGGGGFNLLGVDIGLPHQVIMPDNFASNADIVVYVIDAMNKLIFVGKLSDFVWFFLGFFGDIRMYVDNNTIGVAITKFHERVPKKENADNLAIMLTNVNVV